LCPVVCTAIAFPHLTKVPRLDNTPVVQ
jgi:hypothetical protein